MKADRTVLHEDFATLGRPRRPAKHVVGKGAPKTSSRQRLGLGLVGQRNRDGGFS
jgi:hypothetical protein